MRARKLLGDVGEELVEAVGGVETTGTVEKLGGESFLVAMRCAGLTKVIGAKGFVVNTEHAAMLAAGNDVPARMASGEFGGNGSSEDASHHQRQQPFRKLFVLVVVHKNLDRCRSIGVNP